MMQMAMVTVALLSVVVAIAVFATVHMDKISTDSLVMLGRLQKIALALAAISMVLAVAREFWS